MSFIKTVFVLLGTKVFLFLLSTIINIILARMLGPEGKGIYTLTVLVGSTLFMIGNLGLTSSIIYFTGKEKYELKVIVGNVLTIGLVTGAVLSLIIIWVAYNFHIPFLKGVDPLFISIMALSTPIVLARSYLNSVSVGKGQIIFCNWLNVIERGTILLAFFTLFIFSRSLIVNAIISNIVAAIVTGMISLFFVSKMTKIVLGIQRTVIVAISKFGLKVYFTNMMLFGERKLDVFILNFFLNPAAVGYYTLATGLAEFLRYIPQMASAALYPKIASSSKKDIKEYTPKVCRHIIFLTILGCLVMGLLGEPIIKFVYGKAFLPALPVFWVFLPGMVFFAITKVLLSDLLGRGRPMVTTVASSIGIFSSVFFNFLLIPRWGMFGAAAAGVISYFLTAIILFIFYLRISKNSWVDMLVFTKDDFRVYLNIIKGILVRRKRVSHEN
ncbi:MAG: flippase [bacterium]|nr:flippase [bacterium]